LAQQTGDRGYETLGYRMTGVGHFFLGHYREARTHLEAGLACYSALLRQERAPATDADIERAIYLWAWLPHVLLGLGYPEQAIANSHKALDCVRPDGPAHAQAIMLTIAAVSFYAMARRPVPTLHHAEELLSLATEHEMVGFRGWANFFCGWAHTALGKQRRGLVEMTKGWEHLQATNTQGSLPQLSILLAEAYMRSGQNQKGAVILKKAHNLATTTATSSHLAEIYRLQGTLCEATDPAQAETRFLQAIEVAQAQKAKFWELRATIELVRLWQAQGREREAYARLTTTYEWFTEGFDMPDLVEARTLLAELAQCPE
jgi:predicted ATPase